jgi:hypothetical protein
MRRSIPGTALLLPLLVLGLGGCGAELTAGGQTEVQAVVTSEDGVQSSSASHAPLFSTSGSSAAGRMEVDARVTLVAENGVETRLTQNPVSGSFQIEQRDSALIGRGSVPATRYTRARITFTRVQAEVSGGLPVLGTIRVDLGTVGQVTVDTPLLLEPVPGRLETVVVDMNAHVWLASANPVTRLVAASTFASAVEIRVQ